MNRTPPEAVRRRLRSEVGFGCPVEGCDSPYLTWHHFDPPWAEKEHHNPDGIVAMCVEHHGKADQGAWTKDQLRAFKDPKQNHANDRMQGQFHWKRERLVLLAGGNWWTGCAVLLQCGPIPLIWLSRDKDGYELLNLDLFDSDGVPRLQLRDNDWIVDRKVEDLECPPKKASLTVRTKTLGAELRIAFQPADPDVITAMAATIAEAGDRATDEWLKRMPEHLREYVRSRPSPKERGQEIAGILMEGLTVDDSALCVIEGRLTWPVEISLESAQIILPGHNTLSGSLVKGAHVGIQIN